MPPKTASRFPGPTIVILGCVLTLSLALLSMGRDPWCECGTFRLWYSLANGPETSQQLFDWYTFTHVVHGILLYAVVVLLGRSAPKELRFLAAMAAETSWEILENSPWIIDRYRTTTIALHYYGDSVLNSIGDLLAAAVGYGLAAVLPVWSTACLALGLELMLAYAIRDNLTLNLIMLVRPIEAVKSWQSALH